MQLIRLVMGLVLVVGIGATPADAQYYPQRYPQEYVPAFTPAWAAPRLNVEPTIGRPGTEVHITGPRFHRGVRAYYGNVPMRIITAGRNYLIAVIPPDVRGENYIYVVDNTGRARTAVPFTVGPGMRGYHARPYSNAPPVYRYDRY